VLLEPLSLSALAATLGLGDHELVSLVGGGGKTTLLFALGAQLEGKVVLTTTTKMGSDRLGGHKVLLSPSDDLLLGALEERSVQLVWREVAEHKALGVAPEVCDRWFGLVDHVVVEADGSRRMPFKAPRAYEPVVPARTTLLVACVGASALGAVVAEQCQRPDRVAALAECSQSDRLTPQRLAKVLLSDQGSRKGCPPSARFVVAINGVEASHMAYLAELAEHIGSATLIICIAPFTPPTL